VTALTRAQQRAAGLLAHYFMTAFQAAGLDWDSDHASEVEEMVEAFTDIVRDEIHTARLTEVPR
jgi:hypothetical protein